MDAVRESGRERGKGRKGGTVLARTSYRKGGIVAYVVLRTQGWGSEKVE